MLNQVGIIIFSILTGCITIPIVSEFCHYFGSQCQSNCTKSLVHQWGISLCTSPSQKCCPPESLVRKILRYKNRTRSRMQSISTPSNIESSEAKPITIPEIHDSNSSDSSPFLENILKDVCGIPLESQRYKRVAGGKQVSRKVLPWIVVLKNAFQTFSCQGALLSERWVITVAHCFRNMFDPAYWKVGVGQEHLHIRGKKQRDVKISKIIVHPSFALLDDVEPVGDMNSTALSNRFDIALVKLEEVLQLTEVDSAKVCLPIRTLNETITEEEDNTTDINDDMNTNLEDYDQIHMEEEEKEREGRGEENRMMAMRDEEEENLEVINNAINASRKISYEDISQDIEQSLNCGMAGWGIDKIGSYGPFLRAIQGNIISRENCSQVYNISFEENILCFGNGYPGPCKGDSGSPVTCEKNGQYYIIGIVSWGVEQCGLEGYPTILTRIGSYLDWIQQTMNGKEE